MGYDEKQMNEKELRRLLKDPNVMHEIMKNAYIPVGRSTAEMIEEVLQDEKRGWDESQDES